MDDGDEYVPAEVKVHIGKNCFAVAKRQYGTVDIRHYFFTNASQKSLHPTRKGIGFSVREFENLISFKTLLEVKWSGLQNLKECCLTHADLGDTLECEHCTPKPPTKNKKNEEGLEMEAAVEEKKKKKKNDEKNDGSDQDDVIEVKKEADATSFSGKKGQRGSVINLEDDEDFVAGPSKKSKKKKN